MVTEFCEHTLNGSLNRLVNGVEVVDYLFGGEDTRIVGRLGTLHLELCIKHLHVTRQIRIVQ